MRVFAAIDTGSNAVRMLVARMDGNGILVRLRYERTTTRLAEGFFCRTLQARNMERTLDALKRYSDIIFSSYGRLSGMRAVGTSALREAGNGREFIGRVFERTGIRLEAITHEEEARLSALGVTGLLKPAGLLKTGGLNPVRNMKALILDIGGGSTEWMLTEGQSLESSGSFPIGVVKLADLFLLAGDGEAALEREISSFGVALKTAIFSMLSKQSGFMNRSPGTVFPPGTAFIVTGGTASTMAAIDLGLARYEHELVHGREIGLDRLAGMCRQLNGLSLEQRKSVPGLEPDRADLIIPGLRLIIKIMEEFGFNLVISSDTGLPEGIILDLDKRENRNSGFNGFNGPF